MAKPPATDKKKGPGRPPLREKRRQRFVTGFNPEERAVVKAAAALDGDAPATWIRKQGLAAAKLRIAEEAAKAPAAGARKKPAK
jgi:hypothetical protein